MTAATAPGEANATSTPRAATEVDKRSVSPGPATRLQPALAMDLVASVALASFSFAVAVGFARVFTGWDFLRDMIVLIVVGHGAGLLLRRLGVPAWISVPALVIVMIWIFGLVFYKSTYSWALPSGDTWTLFHADLVSIRNEFGRAVPPVIGGQWNALAGAGIAIAVALADIFAFRADARAEALVPGGVLFIFIAALGDDRSRIAVTVLLIGTGVVATVVLRARHASINRTASARTPVWPSLARLAPIAVVSGVLIAALAGFVGPRLPGADAAPIYDTRGSGGSGGVTEVVSPLVDIRSRLVDRSDSEMFVVQANLESYWRSSALPRFDGSTWGLPERTLVPVDASLTSARPGAVELRQQINILNLRGSLVPAAPDPYQASPAADLRWSPETATLVTVGHQLESGDVFQIVSASPRFEPGQLAAASSTASAAGDPIYVELPDDLPDVVGRTAAEVTAGANTPYAAALALQNWFRTNFDYSLEVQSGHGNSAIETFLRERIGYCEQFAGTYAAMMRTLGIPSRVAVGFTSGTQTSPGSYTVLGRNAHAWPEVWFDGLGWVPFEPTPGRGAPGAEDYTDVTPQQDSTPPPPPWDGESEQAPATTITSGSVAEPQQPDPLEPEAAPPAAPDTTAAEPTPSGGSGTGWIILSVMTALAAITAAPAAVRRWRLHHSAGTPDQQIANLWHHSLDAINDVGVPTSPTQTPLETAAAAAAAFPIAARPMTSLAAVVTEAVYRPGGTTGFETVGTYGSSTLRDCANWTHQIDRAVNDSVSRSRRLVRYFTRWN